DAIASAQTAAGAHATANREEWVTPALVPALHTADAMYLPGRTHFDEAIADIKTLAIPDGANFLDRTNMYHAEAMYNFNQVIDPSIVEIVTGANYRVYDLNSEGTLFTLQQDGSEFDIREWGAYLQAARSFTDAFRLTASMRYDKNENFKGQFSPRVSAVYTVADHHNFRASCQRGFRIPTTQTQYIDLLTPQARLVGGLPLFRDKYNMNNNPVYALSDVNNQDFTPYEFKEWEPERVETYEVGYKSLINGKLLVDLFYYYNRFLSFEGSVVLLQRANPDGPITDLANPS